MNIFLNLTDILKTAQIIKFDLAVVFTSGSKLFLRTLIQISQVGIVAEFTDQM